MIKKKSLSAKIFITSVGVIVLLSIMNKGIFAANVTLPTHSFEGNSEKISLELPGHLDFYPHPCGLNLDKHKILLLASHRKKEPPPEPSRQIDNH